MATERSTEALQSLNESYGILDNLLSSSKTLVSTLVSSQKSDTWYLETAFWILVYTIAWLVFRRIFYGPIRYLIYLPARWMLDILLTVLNLAFGIVTASAGGEAVSSESLVVKSSAGSWGTHRFNPNMARPSVPSGAGGQGAKEGKEGDRLVDKVGKMAVETREREEEQKREGGSGESVEVDDPEIEEEASDEAEEEGEEPHETVLREPTAEETPNAKKRMWEEPVEEGVPHDEL